MRSIALFGGTFNPVHLGHEYLLREILKEVHLDKVIVIPSKIPPHKQAHDLAGERERLDMCRLAFADIEQAELSDFELRREGKSYSLYTVEHFKKLYPDDRLYFIMGSDMLLTFHEWYEYEKILAMCGIICISRDNDDTPRLKTYAEGLGDRAEVIIVNAPPFEISSTEIRGRLKKHIDCSCYLNKNVVQYIVDKKLYRQGV